MKISNSSILTKGRMVGKILSCLTILFVLCQPSYAVPNLALDDMNAAKVYSEALDKAGNNLEDQAFIIRCALSEKNPIPNLRSSLEGFLALSAGDNAYLVASLARTKAEAAKYYSTIDPAFSHTLASAADSDLAFFTPWLDEYGNSHKVHNFDEPLWIKGQPEAVSQAVLAMCALEDFKPSNDRRDRLEKFSKGLTELLRGDYSSYPFGSHFSYYTLENKPRLYTVPYSGDKVAGASFVVEHNFATGALAKAFQICGDRQFLDSSRNSGFGMQAHLALCGRIPYDYAPRPEFEVSSSKACATVAENLIYLEKAAANPVFACLAGCVSADFAHVNKTPLDKVAFRYISNLLASSGASNWQGARDLQKPFDGQVVELEDGKAVETAFNTHELTYMGGTPGKLCTVGRDNMFWMRFDVDREDQYYFYLCFLKSDVSGGLVSVMMRIDGDQIFQINLGGATDDPFVDVDLVAGPRLLRQGPHSFGIRFSGLLMKHPAVLDSIIVEPAVQRRWLKLTDGRTMLVMNSISDKEINVRMEELENNPDVPFTISVVNSNGKQTPEKLTKDRRNHKWLACPAGGVVMVEWKGDISGMEVEK